jgi:membrane-associated phospholipid phosphatase
MAVYGLYFLVNYTPYFKILPIHVGDKEVAEAFSEYITINYIFLALITVVIPLSFFPFLYFQKVITSLHLKNHRERVLPLVIFAVTYYLCDYLFYHKIEGPLILTYYLYGGFLLMVSLGVISYFWKISLHMAGIGGLAGLIIGTAFSIEYDLLNILAVVIILAGVLGSARLYLKAHTPLQVYAGFVLSALIISCTIIFELNGIIF